ncbi:hypothetical protein N0V82_010455 [Gnomoniopsis sp. IMI 355080]|nr:hypothetical protein N0V82_010455 [Gnomoniopsis sp. IMI 355080]
MQVTFFISVVGGAALVAGVDLAGFQLAIDPTLLVVYGSVTGMGGAVVDKNATAQQPLLAVPSAVSASSLAIMMVDLDIPSSTQPTTFLHWIQTDLAASTTPETIMTAQGNVQGFGVNLAKNTAAIVPYTQPNPPAQNPLSHRYTQLLIDTSQMTSAGLTALQTAAQNRVNFNINTTLQEAGLSQSVIAWNFFNVTNPGPAASTASTGAGAKANADTQGGKTKKSKGDKGAGATATNSTSTAGGKKGAKGGANVASTGNSTTSGTGKKGGKKGSGDVTSQSNSTTSDTGKKAGKKGKGGANSTTTDTGNGGKKGKGGKGSNSTAAAGSTGAGTQVSSGAVTGSNSSGSGTVTVSESAEQRGLHSVLLALCLVGAAILAL